MIDVDQFNDVGDTTDYDVYKWLAQRKEDKVTLQARIQQMQGNLQKEKVGNPS